MLYVSNGNLVDVALSALNKLTFDGALARDSTAGKFTKLVLSAQAPQNDPHPRSYELVRRIASSGLFCKIKLSPGTELGTAVDVESTDITDEMVDKRQMGDARASAKDTRGAANPSKFQDGYFTTLFSCCSKPSPSIGDGSNVKVLWNPFPNQTYNNVNGTQKAEIVPAFLILAHELLHADRMMRGKSLGDVVGFKSLGAANANLPNSNISSMVDIEHIEMIGLTSPDHQTQDQDVITENEIRAEHGYNLRTKY